ncbi:MAG TPA: SHOCT domain-containing protein [Verrucomicrobiae bacterium]|nr:SHOCT domain-containing protein [Verrucomicrobiae bacterium]
MKKLFFPLIVGLSITTLLSGCLAFQLGGGTTKKEGQHPTTGQQLVDLQRAKDSGAITDAEYQTQKTKVLNDK